MRRQLGELIRDLREARLAAGLTQSSVARAMRVSRQQLSLLERGTGGQHLVHLARFGSTVGLDVSLRAFRTDAPLRDVAHLRALARAREAIGTRWWMWSAEVPVTSDPSERRAFDAVLERDGLRIGLEVITRLTDAQAQARAASLKQAASGLARLMLVLPRTRHNTESLRAAASTLVTAFPVDARRCLRSLRAGRVPEGNGVLLV